MTQKDIRTTASYSEAEVLYKALRQPGTGLISDASEIDVSPDGSCAVFTGALIDKLEGAPQTRICSTDLVTGDTRVLTFGPNMDRLPKYSPDGRLVAFLSDRQKEGDFQLHMLDLETGAARSAPRVEGWVEYLHWSPEGRRVLLGVAGHGADLSGGQGAITSKQISEPCPSWMPAVESGDAQYRWRRAWVYELDNDRVNRVSPLELNVWEATWCGNTRIAAVVSTGPSEGLWYRSHVAVIDVRTGASRELYRPVDQLGWPATCPSGRQLAIVEALCSDRGLVAGELRLIDSVTGTVRCVETRGVDITYIEWCSETRLLLAGHRGFDTVVAIYDVAANCFDERWCSRDITTAGRYVTVSASNEEGDCALVGESYVLAPEIACIEASKYRAVRSFDQGYSDYVNATLASVELVSWSASDGLEIQGYVLRPKGAGPYPLVMNIHGGPAWHWRPTWLGRWGVFVLMLLRRGVAVFFPNPRGSGGRGREFVRRVLGEMGGADTYDYLSGIDHLIAQGLADSQRLGVTGGSYGGFMSAWLITQDPSRFAAAVPVAPVINWVTEHLLSNIPHFASLFLADTYTNASGNYFHRSPLMHAHKVRTPTLIICGALDCCTPPEEAVQFHNALQESEAKSSLVIYPEEGHGIRKFPSVIDYTARVVDWFEEHLGR